MLSRGGPPQTAKGMAAYRGRKPSLKLLWASDPNMLHYPVQVL
jgi:hypothetical protein